MGNYFALLLVHPLLLLQLLLPQDLQQVADGGDQVGHLVELGI